MAFTCTSCMMSGLGKSQTPPFETAEMSTPSYWNWFWSLLDPKMMKRESLGTWLMLTAGAKVTTSKYDWRAVGMFSSSARLKLVEKPAFASIHDRRLARHRHRLLQVARPAAPRPPGWCGPPPRECSRGARS